MSRARYADLPSAVRSAIEHQVAGAITSTAVCPDGYTRGVAELLHLADDRAYFVKALPVHNGGRNLEGLREQLRVTPLLPATIPTPRLAFHVEERNWLALIFDGIKNGRPPEPTWPDAEINAVGRLLTGTATALSPCPIPGLPKISETHSDRFRAWRRPASADSRIAATDLPAIALRNLRQLAELEEGWAAAAAGDAGAHLDIREDNIVIDSASCTWIVDWTYPALAAPWVDLVSWAPTIARSPQVLDDLLRTHPLTAEVHPVKIDAVLAALAGAWAERATQPADNATAGLRTLQRSLTHRTLALLRHRGVISAA